VRLLLSGLSVSSLASPSDGWTEDGRRVFVNAVEWAAAPGMGAISARVSGAGGATPAAVTARIVETGVSVTADSGGAFTLSHPPGGYTLEVRAFGYSTQTIPVTLAAGRVDDLGIELALGQVGDVRGIVTDRETGTPLAGAKVRVDGVPRETVTGEDGRFTLSNVEAGSYVVRAEADGYVRQLFREVVVTAVAGTTLNLALRASPKVAVVDDYEGRAKAYLAEWGYRAEDLDWTDTARVDGYDLIVANLASFPNRDPGEAGWAAFADAVDRAAVPVIWLDQFGRGATRWLSKYAGDPQVRGEGRSHGTVEAKVLTPHPLVEGFKAGDSIPLTGSGKEYGFFTGYSGVTVANLVTGTQGERGGAIAYRGRTAGSVDVLLSTLSISFYGYPAIGGQPALNWTPQAETLFHNALRWTLDAPPLAADVRGTVRSSATGAPIASTVSIVETGAQVAGRAGDGSYLVALQPGTWTLRISAFGHGSVTRTVTVAAGDRPTVDVTLTADGAGRIAGTVTGTAGAPVGGASVTLEGTPLATTTAADGGYSLPTVPAGGYVLRVQAAGYGQQRLPITVHSGQLAQLDVALSTSQVVAVAGDFQNAITTLLTANGYEVRQWNWTDIQNHIGELDEVGLVVLNGNTTAPTAAKLTPFLQAAAAAEVSVIMAGQWGSGSIRTARTVRNDPSGVTDGFTADGVGITYRPSVAHPIFAGFEVGEPVVLMRNPGGSAQQWQWFSGYSGETIAAIGDEVKGDLGGGVGYRFTSPSSVEILLEGLMASTYGRPGERWTPEGTRIYLNAVQWALGASQAEITGAVTAGGTPVAGAEVRAVEAGLAVTTGPDGRFRLGLADGTHTVRVTALGFAPYEATLTLGVGQSVELAVELVSVPRGAIAGTVRDAAGRALAGVRISASGPQPGAATTAADGSFTLPGLVPGEYRLVVDADHFATATATATVVAGETARVPVTLHRNEVAVLGDAGGVLTDFLSRNGVNAEETEWGAPVDIYTVVVVNGGGPSRERFEALLAAADAAEVSLVFTGTWGVDSGGIRLLERFGGGVVTVGGQGYRDGAVGLTGFDPAHPLFAGVPDPAAILAPDSYWSGLSGYAGTHLAELAVQGRPGAGGVAVGYDFRTARSMHLLVSFSAVTGLIGPGYGWTPGTERLILNAVGWAATAEETAPSAPTLDVSASPVAAPEVTLTGTARFRTTVTVYRDGAALGTATPGRDGRFSLPVPLAEGANAFTAVAANHGGASPESNRVTVLRDSTGPALVWTPADRTGFFAPAVTVAGTATDAGSGVSTLEVNGVPVAIGAGGGFSAPLNLAVGQNTITVVATDALGNKSTEVRTVRLFPYSAAWQFTGHTPVLNAFLSIADGAGRPVRVDAATLVLRDATGAEVRRAPMSRVGNQYKATVLGVAPGTYTVTAELDLAGVRVTISGGEVRW
jgi:hypothetical protein